MKLVQKKTGRVVDTKDIGACVLGAIVGLGMMVSIRPVCQLMVWIYEIWGGR